MLIYRCFRCLSLTCLTFLALVLAAACGDDGAGPRSDPDAGNDAAVPIDGSDACSDNDQCDDGIFCNGTEFCDDTQCKRGAPINCDDHIECTTDVCSDSTSSCRYFAPDFDNDGHADARCVDKDDRVIGDDCDDENGNRFAGNIEICDEDDLDEDCDATTIGDKDQDNDGAIDSACCNRDDANARNCGTDCDDLKPSVNPGASEVCDLFDNDCDGMADEAGSVSLYPDADFDGHGETGTVAESQCAGTAGYSTDDDDCDDSDPTVHAAQVEICDGKDNDCNLAIDESPRAVYWYADLDGDGFGGRLEAAVFSCAPVADHDLRDNDCDDQAAAINPGAAELCDGIDNNCDGRKTAKIALNVNDFEDDDNDGSADFACGLTGDDCDDTNSATGGNLIEICDKLDNDCDDKIDENVADTVWYMDADGDGYGNERLPAVVFCAPLAGRSAYPGDCDDADYSIHPGAFEVCGLDLLSTGDEDCDGQVDEGFCPICGDGIVEGPEQCDDRASNSLGTCVDPDGVCNDDLALDGCREDCRRAHCGDGVMDTGESCDLGTMNSGLPNAACRPDCTPSRCGDGIFDDMQEPCEPGAGTDGAICLPDCTFPGWIATGCSSVPPLNLGSAVGLVVPAAATGTGTDDVIIDLTADPLGLTDCGFSGPAPTGPEQVYTWSAPASLLYALSVSNAAHVSGSRLTIGMFFNGGPNQTSCVLPWACLEPPTSQTALLVSGLRNEPSVIVVDSVSDQAFDLFIYPMLCCPAGTPASNPGTCAVVHDQAQLDCALAAAVSAVGTSCLDAWSPACVAAADLACAYTCP